MRCKRCGMEMKQITYRHERFCQRVPLPKELASEYLNTEKTYEELASDYDCSVNSLRQRLLFGLGLLGKTMRQVGRRRTPPDKKKQRVRPDTPRCSCGIILRTAVQRQRKKCDFCAGVAFDYMKFKQEETEPQRAIPVSVSLSL